MPDTVNRKTPPAPVDEQPPFLHRLSTEQYILLICALLVLVGPLGYALGRYLT